MDKLQESMRMLEKELIEYQCNIAARKGFAAGFFAALALVTVALVFLR